jgi:hypothetical protein
MHLRRGVDFQDQTQFSPTILDIGSQALTGAPARNAAGFGFLWRDTRTLCMAAENGAG